MTLDLAYQDEQDIIDAAKILGDAEICFFPAESELGHRALASIRGETLRQRERPDFEDVTRSVMLESMIVDDHPRPNKKDATRANQDLLLKSLRKAGFAEMFPNASLVTNVNSGLALEKDHNYQAYLAHFTAVVRKHASQVHAYRAEHPGFDLGFLIFDESTAYVESSEAFGSDQQARPHAHFADKAFTGAVREAAIDFVAWLTPNKLLSTNQGVFPLPRLTIIDVSLLDGHSEETYDAIRMISSER